MKIYKNILKILLFLDLTFVFVIAILGFQKEHNSNDLLQTATPILEKKSKTHLTNQNEKKKVFVIGKTVGIYANTNGILVIDTGEVIDFQGNTMQPAKNKLIQGDYITAVNTIPIRSKKELVDYITKCNGETLVFSIRRRNQPIQVAVQPVETQFHDYKVGIWVRDDLQGLGTLTYIDENRFGALGHSINDIDTGQLLNVSGGQLYEANIYGLKKGKTGKPGVIEGMILYDSSNKIGKIKQNSIYGIFGQVSEEYLQQFEDELYPVACENEVKKGKAYIQSYISGKKEKYEIEIVDIKKNQYGDKEMEIQVKDSRLISLTGGIVQGMSGSPIIQDGKLVGAVTHVFVDDPTKGYAIFIENMLEHDN